MIAWPADLVTDIAARRSVMFLGAGVSQNSVNDQGQRPLDWVQFITHVADLLTDASERDQVVANIRDGDLLTACELARDFISESDFISVLLSEYADKRFSASRIHDDLSRIDSRFVLTTNFDKLYENRASQVQDNTIIVKSYYDTDVADCLRRSQRVVLKVHGTIDSPGKAIFTRGQYAVARTQYSEFYSLLRALFATHTFVFLGASLRDPDIRLILEDYAYTFPGARPHFIVMPAGTVMSGVQRVMEKTMNLRTLPYDSSNHHEELGTSLTRLVEEVEAERYRLTETMNW